ncbi:MAG: hypothetical protein NZ108_10485, partial [Bacteroidia bacterium]|nr:hypothetical protein [Bacteroidia bacterium]
QGRWQQASFTFPAAAEGITNLRIAFRWRNNEDNVGTDPSFAVDDIVITGDAPAVPVTNNYIGPNGGSWHVAANWSLGNVPDQFNENARIPADKSVVISMPVNTQHVCNYGTITIDQTTSPNLNVGGFLLNEGAITSNGTNSSADVQFWGPKSRYRGNGTNRDADYVVRDGKLTLDSDLNCRSLQIRTELDASNRIITLQKNFTAFTNSIFTRTGNTVILNGPCITCIDNTNGQVISGFNNFTFNNLTISKSSGTVTFANTNTYRIENQLRITGGILDAALTPVQTTTTPGPNAGLTMTGGEFHISRVATVPEITGTYSLTGGTVRFYGANQVLRNTTYHNVVVEGTGTKTLAGNVTVNNRLTINASILNAATNTLAGPGELFMTGGELQIAKLSTTIPELTGSYSLT